MSTFLIPIEGLNVVRPIVLGSVVVHSRESASDRLVASPLGATDNPAYAELVDEHVGALAAWSLAEVDAVDVDAALTKVAAISAVLRVFQQVRFGRDRTTSFGVPDRVVRSHVRYVELGERAGVGSSFRGRALGWTFNEDALTEIEGAAAFRFVSRSHGGLDSEGTRRARVGVELLAQAIDERTPAYKMLYLVMALEAMLLSRRSTSQTYRLARHIAYFGCGYPDDLCGRARSTCPYLELVPGVAAETRLLKILRVRGQEPPWRCAEWHRVVDWYDLRSDIAHGATIDVSKDEAERAEFWILTRLTEPILEWLAAHDEQPIEDLSAAIEALPLSPYTEALRSGAATPYG